MSPDKDYDLNRPEAQAYRHAVRYGTFVRRGTMIAFPTCFPGASVAMPLDESRITALCRDNSIHIYGGTSGVQCHLFVAAFHDETGCVFDLGAVDGTTECTAVCCGDSSYLACLNGPDGGRIIHSAMGGIDANLLQEWGFRRPELQPIETPFAGEPIVHAVAAPDKKSIIGVTTRRIFRVPFNNPTVEILDTIDNAGRIAVASDGAIVGIGRNGHLWAADPASGRVNTNHRPLPAGNWQDAPPAWAHDTHDDALYTTDATGTLFRYHARQGWSKPLAKTPLTPVGPMAITHDGRLFGFCGDGMANLFSYDPDNHQVENLGVALSVIQRRRYGYTFADAVVGRDGEIYFAENDNLGHLWLYFPPVAKRKKA